MTNYEFKELSLNGAYEVNCFSTGDIRGTFTKFFEKSIFKDAGIEFNLSEVFASFSRKNVIRGLHFQLNNPQAKLVCALSGLAWDVIVDLRPKSRTYGNWLAIELSADNNKALYVPRGFAHGFASCEDNTSVLYMCEGSYDKETDTGIRFDDVDLGVKWPISSKDAIYSDRDKNLMSFEDYKMNPVRL